MQSKTFIKKNLYFDSLILMKILGRVSSLPEVKDVLVGWARYPQMGSGRENEEPIVYGILDEKMNKNNRLEIVLSKDQGVDYISIESKRRKEDNITWTRTGKIKMTLHRLKRILTRASAIENPNPDK